MERIIKLDSYSSEVHDNHTHDANGTQHPMTKFLFQIAVHDVIHKLYRDGVTMEEAVGLIGFDHTAEATELQMESALIRFSKLQALFPDARPDSEIADMARSQLMSVDPDAWAFTIQGHGMSMSWSSLHQADWLTEGELPPQLARAMRDGRLRRTQTPLFAGQSKVVEDKDGKS